MVSSSRDLPTTHRYDGATPTKKLSGLPSLVGLRAPVCDACTLGNFLAAESLKACGGSAPDKTPIHRKL